MLQMLKKQRPSGGIFEYLKGIQLIKCRRKAEKTANCLADGYAH